MDSENENQKHIEFLTSNILQYLEVIRVNPKGENCRLWIEWIQTWNNEIISLQLPPDDHKKWMQEPIGEIVLCVCNLVGIDRCPKHKNNS